MPKLNFHIPKCHFSNQQIQCALGVHRLKFQAYQTSRYRARFTVRQSLNDEISSPAEVQGHPGVSYEKKSRLRKRAQQLDREGELCKIQVGKGGISDNFLNMLGDAFERRGYIKLKVLEACRMELDEIQKVVQDKTGSICLLRIGSTLFMYRNPTLPQTDQSISPEDDEKREIALINQTLELEDDYRHKQKIEKKVKKEFLQKYNKRIKREQQKEKRILDEIARKKAEQEALKKKPEMFRIIEEDWG